ncbi:type II toxin-antitoxin system RelE/ParE family toxin [Sulfurovum sp. bin170]|uniref:type II toxin-antitoxin system RelE/ParE family toxin n=1 Tax=Sulfurovum sp. bin170 TaxID=2695268 RepID=UPI0013E0BC4D|nr:type II toxin-antitoxin system RelE/ParE family toxin [Sulfurovum sp. bin170]NEW61320.1 type II toxin-antitoxin system RelE/ParE family toxin [Sulfurovum sp. bin170]
MCKIYKLKWTKSAKDDLLSIVEYIKKDSPIVAKDVYKKIREKAKSSNFFPLKGRVVPELQREGITIYREVIATPWRIIYKVGDDTVYIMMIIDSRQNFEGILLHKLLKL